jgi:hypothetical protein
MAIKCKKITCKYNGYIWCKREDVDITINKICASYKSKSQIKKYTTDRTVAAICITAENMDEITDFAKFKKKNITFEKLEGHQINIIYMEDRNNKPSIITVQEGDFIVKDNANEILIVERSEFFNKYKLNLEGCK